MQKEEEVVLKSLGWKGKGLITSAYDAITDESLQSEGSEGESTLFSLIWFLFIFSNTYS